MNRFSGKVGYMIQKEDPNQLGCWYTEIVAKQHSGNILSNQQRNSDAGKVNDDVVITNKFSIIANPFASKNYHNAKYVEYRGTKWEVSTVEYAYPRIILSVGGVYNGQ